MAGNEFHRSFRAQLEWQYAHDPGFRKAWATYMRENAAARDCPPLETFDAGWGPVPAEPKRSTAVEYTTDG